MYPPALYTQYHHEMELLAQLNRSTTPNTDTSHSSMAMDCFDVLSLGAWVPNLSETADMLKTTDTPKNEALIVDC